MRDLGITFKEEDAVEAENLRQVTKWGYQDVAPQEWMCFLVEEVGELAQAVNKVYSDGPDRSPDFTKESIYKEAIQVATLALKIARMHRE